MVFAKLTFQDKDASLDVESFSVQETMSTLFSVSVLVTSKNPSVDLGKFVGKAAALQIDSGYKFAQERGRRAARPGATDRLARVVAGVRHGRLRVLLELAQRLPPGRT